MPRAIGDGGVVMSRYLTELKKSEKNYENAQISMSSGKLTDSLLDPYAATQGQAIKAKINAHHTMLSSCHDATHVCQSINTAIINAIDLLTEQVLPMTNANTDVSDQNSKNIMDISFQTVMKTFEKIVSGVEWNNNPVLTGATGNVSVLNALGIYNNGLAISSSSNSFNFGGGDANVSSFKEYVGSVSGAVGSITNSGTVVTVAIGTQTFSVDTNGLTLNRGDTITLVDQANANNTISFTMGSANPSVAAITTGISAILSGLVFNSGISNIHPVTNFFTGGINYNYTNGNYTGTAQNVSVEQVGNQFQITLQIAQNENQIQYFRANITDLPIPGSPLVFNSLSNSENSIAFNLTSSLNTPLTKTGLENALTSLLGINGSPSTFKAMSVDPYQGVTINANGATQSGTYGLTYTVTSPTMGKFTLNSGHQSFDIVIDRPIKNNMVYNFPNGVSIKISDVSAFDETASKGQSLFTVDSRASQNILYFQTGITSSDQLEIVCPSLSLNNLNLSGLDIRSTQNAQNALMLVQQAINTLSNELGRIADIAKTVEETLHYSEDSLINFKTENDQYTGTDIVKALVEATQNEAKMNVIYTSLSKEMERQEKNLELLRSV